MRSADSSQRLAKWVELTRGQVTRRRADGTLVRARSLHRPTADLGRMQRQQRFLGSMSKKRPAPVSCSTRLVDSFPNAALQSVNVDKGMSRDMLLSSLAKFRDSRPATSGSSPFRYPTSTFRRRSVVPSNGTARRPTKSSVHRERPTLGQGEEGANGPDSSIRHQRAGTQWQRRRGPGHRGERRSRQGWVHDRCSSGQRWA